VDSASDFIRKFKEHGWRTTPDPYATVVQLIQAGSPLLFDVAVEALRELDELPPFVIDLIDHLSDEQLGKLAEMALELGIEDASAAQLSLLSAVAYQSPSALASHLEQIYELAEPFNEDFGPAWRAANADEVARLDRLLSSSEPELPLVCIFETQRLDIIGNALARALPMESSSIEYLGRCSALHIDHGRVNSLVAGPCYHLEFEYGPNAYNQEVHDDWARVGKRPNLHPTISIATDNRISLTFGGALENACGICGGQLHKLLELSALPASFHVSAPPVVLATCLRCLYWEKDVLSYEHDVNGSPHSLDSGEAFRETAFVTEPFAEVTVKVSRTPPRWQEQRWVGAQQNLNRLGGRPTWVQLPDFPNCPKCNRVMPFIAQFDSYLATRSGYQWLWGSGGVGYFFWCDNCRASASRLQCT